MTTLFKHESLGGRLARTALLCLLALAATLLQSREARAQWTTSGTNTTTTGNVGVGTTAPEAGLHVKTASIDVGARGIINEQTSADGNGGLLVFRKSRAGAAVQSGDSLGNFYAAAFDGTGWVNGPSRIRFYVDAPVTAGSVPTALQFLTGGNGTTSLERMRITSGGNVGIGTTDPASAKLVVSSNAATPFAPQPGTILHLVNADANKTRLNIDSFGLGGEPSVTFRSARGTAAAPSSTQAGDRLAILHGTGFGTTQFIVNAKPNITMQATENWSDTAAGSAITFSTVANGTTALAERLRVSNDGNVGVGTNAPAAKLHVAGDIRVDGNINAKYQDVAEWVPTTQKLAAGTVVILDAERTNHVLASRTSYDTAVAGVVSAKPGISLGEAGVDKALVATTGRVKVRVDATRAPIKIGDLIVTSDLEGVAMKSEPVVFGGRRLHAPGTIIGKALEPLAGGRGEILVLLSLQ